MDFGEHNWTHNTKSPLSCCPNCFVRIHPKFLLSSLYLGQPLNIGVPRAATLFHFLCKFSLGDFILSGGFSFHLYPHGLQVLSFQPMSVSELDTYSQLSLVITQLTYPRLVPHFTLSSLVLAFEFFTWQMKHLSNHQTWNLKNFLKISSIDASFEAHNIQIISVLLDFIMFLKSFSSPMPLPQPLP